jgi:hypothetical protein
MLIKTIKRIVRPFIPLYLIELKKRNKIGKQFRELEVKEYEYLVPAHYFVKERTNKEYQKKYNYAIFIEARTCFRDIVEAQKNNFKNVFSVELEINLFNGARKRFETTSGVSIFQGDSAAVLKEIIKDLNEPAVFWLDAQYPGGKAAKGAKKFPIIEEIEFIFKNNRFSHILLIDNARSFYELKNYPIIENLTALVRRQNSNYKLKFKDDMIQFLSNSFNYHLFSKILFMDKPI